MINVSSYNSPIAVNEFLTVNKKSKGRFIRLDDKHIDRNINSEKNDIRFINCTFSDNVTITITSTSGSIEISNKVIETKENDSLSNKFTAVHNCNIISKSGNMVVRGAKMNEIRSDTGNIKIIDGGFNKLISEKGYVHISCNGKTLREEHGGVTIDNIP